MTPFPLFIWQMILDKSEEKQRCPSRSMTGLSRGDFFFPPHMHFFFFFKWEHLFVLHHSQNGIKHTNKVSRTKQNKKIYFWKLLPLNHNPSEVPVWHIQYTPPHLKEYLFSVNIHHNLKPDLIFLKCVVLNSRRVTAFSHSQELFSCF